MALRRLLGACLLGLLAIGSGACDDKLGVGTTPRIRVVPNSHAFGSVAVGQEEPVRITDVAGLFDAQYLAADG